MTAAPTVAEQVAALMGEGGRAFGEGRLPDALAAFDAAVALAPDFPPAVGNRGAVLQALGRLDEAWAAYDRLAGLLPAHPEAHVRRGDIRLQQDRPGEALTHYDQALARDPRNLRAWASRGAALQALDRPQEAVDSYDQALALDPGFMPALANRGLALRELNRLGESIASLEAAARLAPDEPAVQANLGVSRLLAGDLPAGFAGHEQRWRTPALAAEHRTFDRPLWIGEAEIAGKTLLLHHEQGFGDTIQFCRYAREARARGARVVLEVPAALAELMRCVEGVDQLVVTGEPLPPFDLHCPLMTAPLAFGTTLETIPAETAYLRAPPERVERWRGEVAGEGLKVGVAWFGKPTHKNDRNRSIPLARFAAAMPQGAQVFSLHDRVRAEDEAALEASSVRRFDGRIQDFSDTAALASLMDVVVAVDTSVAHLAAALGRPTWILLPFAPDWRWLLGREDSPWYPTARLFRQPAIGDWESPLSQVRAGLEGLSSPSGRSGPGGADEGFGASS